MLPGSARARGHSERRSIDWTRATANACARLSLSVFLLFLWVFFFSILDYCTQCASPIFPVSLRYTQILSQARSTQLHILRILFYRFILLPAADGVSPFSRYANHLTGGYSFFFHLPTVCRDEVINTTVHSLPLAYTDRDIKCFFGGSGHSG